MIPGLTVFRLLIGKKLQIFLLVLIQIAVVFRIG